MPIRIMHMYIRLIVIFFQMLWCKVSYLFGNGQLPVVHDKVFPVILHHVVSVISQVMDTSPVYMMLLMLMFFIACAV
jgi:hypothetical protein